jgi:hypothetical protein
MTSFANSGAAEAWVNRPELSQEHSEDSGEGGRSGGLGLLTHIANDGSPVTMALEAVRRMGTYRLSMEG